MFPRLALTGQFGLESDVLSNFLESPYSLLNGAVLAPLFGWGKNRAALNAQKASFEAEVHSYEKTVLNAFKEAKNAIVDFNKIKEVYQLRAKLERSAKGYVIWHSCNTSTASSIIWMCSMPSVVISMPK